MTLEVLSMDLSASVLLAAVPVIVLFISYLIYRIGIGEKSFEEAIEDQKRRSIEEEQKQKSEKVKKEKKFKKTWGKKSKEKPGEASHEASPVPEIENEDLTIEIVEPKESVKPTKQAKKAKAGMNQMQDASPAEEKSKVEISPAKEKAKEEKVQEKSHQDAPEKSKKADSSVQERIKKLEAAVSQDKPKKSDSSPAVQEKKVENEKESKNKAKETKAIENVVVQSASPPQATAQKKKKKEPVEKDAAPLTINKIFSFLKETELESNELQNFINLLLNKQKDSASWTKVDDVAAVTKKHLQEKEQLLETEMRQNQAVTSKLKELREEYNTYRSKMTAQEKVSQEKLARQQQEIQTLTLKVKQIQEQQSQSNKNNEKQLQTGMKILEDEKAKLLQKITKLEAQSVPGITQVEYESLKKSKEDLQKVHTLLVEQHTSLTSVHKKELKNVQTQLSDAKAKVEELSAQNAVLTKDIQPLKNAELAKKTIEEKLKAEEKRATELDIQMKQLSKAGAEIAKLQADLKELRQENERLAEQLVTTKDRVAGDGQEVVIQNGELNGNAQHLEESLEKDKALKERDLQIAQMKDELKRMETKFSTLNEEVEVQKQKNNELREKNWKAMEALGKAEASADQRAKEVQSTADQKISELEKALLSQTSNTSGDKLAEELKKAENEAVQRLSDYNKEVEKNQLLSSQITEVQQEVNKQKQKLAEMQGTVEELKSSLCNCQSSTKECLQRICTSVSIDSLLPYEKWLAEFQQQASSSFQSLESQNSTSMANLDKILQDKESEYLQKENHFNEILGHTESTLSKLQSDAESLQERLGNTEKELQKIQIDRDALLAEKEAMQSTLQQISQLSELEEKLRLLQSTVETTETERSLLQQKYDEVNKNYLNLRDQLESKEKQLEELQKESSSTEKLRNEIEDLKSALDKEKGISKQFSAQMIKLNSLVKIGQDALNEEQNMVKSLKEQLEAVTKVSTANGTTPATKASPVTNSESELKTKSSQKNKKKSDASDKK